MATGHHPSPVPHAHVVTSTTHKTLRGPRSGVIFGNDEEVGKKIDRMIFPGTQGGPLEHVIAGKAVAFFEAARATGAEVLHAPRVWPEYHPNYYGAFVRDPDGLPIQLYQAPFPPGG